MTSVSQILDGIQTQSKPAGDKPRGERKEFKAEWTTAYTVVFQKDGTPVPGVQGFALDEYEHCVVAEVRKSNNFPIPRYEAFVGTRRRGRNVPTVSFRTNTQGDTTTMDTSAIKNVALAYEAAAAWAATDLAAELNKPNVKKALSFRAKRADDMERGIDGANQQSGGHRKTGKTERERNKKRPGQAG